MKKILFIITIIIGTLPTLSAKSDSTQISQLEEIINTSFMEYVKQRHRINRRVNKLYSAEDSIKWNHTTYVNGDRLPVGFEFSDEIKAMGFKVVFEDDSQGKLSYKDPAFRKFKKVALMYGPKLYANPSEIGIGFTTWRIRTWPSGRTRTGSYTLDGIVSIWKYSCEEKKWIFVKSRRDKLIFALQ